MKIGITDIPDYALRVDSTVRWQCIQVPRNTFPEGIRIILHDENIHAKEISLEESLPSLEKIPAAVYRKDRGRFSYTPWLDDYIYERDVLL